MRTCLSERQLVHIAMPAGWKKLSEDEMRLAKKSYEKHKLEPSEIAERLGA